MAWVALHHQLTGVGAIDVAGSRPRAGPTDQVVLIDLSASQRVDVRGVAVDRVLTTVAFDIVVAKLALDDVGLGTTEQVVVTGAAVDVVGATHVRGDLQAHFILRRTTRPEAEAPARCDGTEVTNCVVLIGGAGDDVVAQLAVETVATIFAKDLVVAMASGSCPTRHRGLADERQGRVVAGDHVVVLIAVKEVALVGCPVVRNDSCPVGRPQGRAAAGAARDAVTVGTAVDRVDAVVAFNAVDALLAEQVVVAVAAPDLVVGQTAVDGVATTHGVRSDAVPAELDKYQLWNAENF